MKKRVWILALILALVLSGCSAKETEDLHPEWAGTAFRYANIVAVGEDPEGFTLAVNNDVLAPVGLNYVTWVTGEEKDFINSDGKEVKIYDAQLYFLVVDCNTPERAKSDVEEFVSIEAKNYEVGEIKTIQVGDQEYQKLVLLSGKEGNPYGRGIACFGSREEFAFSIELMCTADYDGDLNAILQGFLENIEFGI
ncbi:MAG: hypothetical protein IJ744_12470 [Lachnospiraceae bacterium]|nr:hypothetical protein [Lachnospiraceae bacterium]